MTEVTRSTFDAAALRAEITMTDMRGGPIGDAVDCWETVLPRDVDAGGPVRVRVMRCEEGWYGASGQPERPDGPAACDALMTDRERWIPGGLLDRQRYRAFHAQHPVIWSVEAEAPGSATATRNCPRSGGS